MPDALTPGAAARLLGVAPSTLRSWDRRYGVGPRGRSPGGHRRYTPDDVSRLRELCRLVGEGMAPADAAERTRDGGVTTPRPPAPPLPRAAGGPTGRTTPTLQGVAHAAMRLDAALVEEILEDALRSRGVVAAWEELAMPLLYGMGRRWEATLRYVEVEHLLSWCVSSALRRVRGPARAPAAEPYGDRPVLLACGPHEMHSLPLEALAAALREAGVSHRVLGACTPLEATVAAVRRLAPRAVVVWCHGADRAGETAVLATARAISGSRPRTRLFTAGPGWRPVAGAERARDGHLTSLGDAVRVLAPRAESSAAVAPDR
ncbi:MerR family transcriptional regulator [Nocardiopsis sp. EMB25]|uniref:MerR family transcriptional regulator n=1 Tax=Nocardiopsis sp. EMB25 TaxID=2835867 RepID=UPI002283B8D0|nr:MerR family transcriptional regulator [Nocardiopsis sp. EMB25]MCY9785364.1 MerR family transcriptional regulator [Nocardiopsis sp. EMB25]